MDVDPGVIFPRTKVGRDHQMRDLFRAGKVIERKVDEKLGPLVRVQYLDKQGVISKWLPIKQPGARATMFFYVPKIGNDVNVTMLPNGSEDGFVDGAFYNEKNPPPEGVDIDTRHLKTEDGTVVEYREIDSTFNLVCVGPVIVKGTMITVEGSQSILEKAPTITIQGEQTVLVTAPEITLTGHMTFNGDITHMGNMTTSGIHTDANGIHAGSKEADDLRREIELLKERVLILEQQVQMRLAPR
jgi:phage baseplate assembly protein V